MIKRILPLAALGLSFATLSAALAAAPIDNSALEQPAFRDHKATYGVVYRLPKEVNAALPDGIATTFKDVSIVEIGFAGNVLREIYRVSLEDGSAIDVASGKPVSR